MGKCLLQSGPGSRRVRGERERVKRLKIERHSQDFPTPSAGGLGSIPDQETRFYMPKLRLGVVKYIFIFLFFLFFFFKK